MLIKCSKDSINLSFCILGLFLFVTFITEGVVYCEKVNKPLVEVSNEMMISSKAMNCDYYLEDYNRLYFNFEYPKLILRNNGVPTVIFIDVVSNSLIFVEVTGENKRIIKTMPAGGNKYEKFSKWPTIYEQNGNIYLGMLTHVISKETKQYNYKIQLYGLTRESYELRLEKETSILDSDIPPEYGKYPGPFLSAVYPFHKDGKKHIFVGRYDVSHFHPLAVFSGEFPTFTKNFSIIWDENKIGHFQTIEEEGWSNAWKRSYSISPNGTAYSAWVRNTTRVGLSTKHSESVYYSEKNGNREWTKPIPLYELEDVTAIDQIGDVSIAFNGESAFVLWYDKDKGIFFNEIKNSIPQKNISIFSIKKVPHDKTTYIEPLYGASFLKIAVDANGTVYALWILNSGNNHAMVLKIRKNGEWLPEIIINKGYGIGKLPDMVVDGNGTIHITFIKQISEKEFGCFYQSIKQNK